MKRKPIASVDLIVVKEDKILLGKVSEKWSAKGEYVWGLPGREIEFGENIEETMKRNLKEELGMKLKNFKVICINNNFTFGHHYIAVGILIEAEGKPKMMKPKDWKEWKWFKKDELPDKLFPSAELTIKCFLENKSMIQ